MKRLFFVAVALSALVVTSLAPAHTGTVSPSCSGVQFTFSDFPGTDTVTYSVSVDGSTVASGTISVTNSGSLNVPLSLTGTHTVSGTASWDAPGSPISGSASVTCGSTPPPSPPSPVPPETTDVQVVKDGTAQAQLANGQAEIAYTVRVRNNGPNQAHDVQLADPAPAGVTFVAVTTQPVAGSCTLTAALVSCSLGTLGPGVERTIGISARVTQTGTYSNCATATGSSEDTNGANNTDCAETLVTAPVTPPTTPTPPTPKPASPKPVRPAEVCRVLTVTPGLVRAGAGSHVVLAKVTRSRTPVAGVVVRFTGIGVAKTVQTNSKGEARLTVRPSKAGILLVRITSAKACNSARIGVVGAFEPPVTG
jgi:uncharacterized repeat protein (TIGR01451 family)